MIKRINIRQFGCFSDFDWATSVREGQTVHDFKRLNILYGRNYSGKTTLSRIFRSFEVSRFPDNYKQPNFEFIFDTGTLTQQDIETHTLDIRVYNRDFIDENLSFLKDNTEGEVKTFAIIGSENKEIEEQIQKYEAKLGNVEGKSGLRYDLDQKTNDYTSKNKKAEKAERSLEDKLRRHANDVIKPNRTFGYPGYNIAGIKKDIQTVEETSIGVLDETQVRQRQDLLREESLPDIDKNILFHPAFYSISKASKDVLAREIKPSAPIQDLLNDSQLQSWVRTGMEHHRHKRSTCGFCGQSLPQDLWEKLDAHFNKESSELEEELRRQIKAIESEIASVSAITLPDKNSFYASERSSFEDVRKTFGKTITTYETEIKRILKQLQARQKDIFKSRIFPELNDVSDELQNNIEELNRIIEANNTTTVALPRKQREARDELRMNAVAVFIRDIDLRVEKKKVADLKEEAKTSKSDVDSLTNEVGNLEREIEALRLKLQDEKKGAEKVNEYLNHFFGHEGLKLVAVEDPTESKYKFQIMRGSEPAYNMSEGECSLVSFCYFIARLEDIETKGKALIVYIDDPVSSLDSNHIFFVFSLIESVLAKPKTNTDGSNRFVYKQLFVSTHNLDFFKYLKRLSMPRNNHGGTEFFIVEKEGSASNLSVMPKYLKDYQTEFHYLFHQIYRCKDGQDPQQNHEIFYNFGNNLRKFLEAYLFYRYPFTDDRNDSLERLRKFFGEDATATALTNRVSNELSHLEGIIDRSMRPIEIPEIPAVAEFVLDKMYEKDKEQFNALLKSIGQPPREDGDI